MFNLTTIDFQAAQAELQKALSEFRGGKVVTVGIHEGAPAVEGEEITMATLGAVQEFGNDRI
ncbi:MAG: hypothetical protein ACREA9_16080, partial [Pyrinomonadaceae bacterium]